MIKLVLVNNVTRKEINGVTPTTTIRSIIEDPHNSEILIGGNFALNGNHISPDEWDKTLADFGVTDFATLVAIKMAANN